AHEVEDARQALLINRDLRLIQLESRELRDVLYVGACESHAVSTDIESAKQCGIWLEKPHKIIQVALLIVASVVMLRATFWVAPPPSGLFRTLHVQTSARLFFQRFVDRSRHCQYTHLRTRQGHRAQRALGRRRAGRTLARRQDHRGRGLGSQEHAWP